MSDFTVLLVDDEEDFQTLLTRRLRRRKYDVRCTSTGAAALAQLDQRVADVVVLDVRLPGMDGLETLERIRRRHPQVQVVMLTGFVDPHLARRARELGAIDFLTKPVNIKALLAKLEEAMARKA